MSSFPGRPVLHSFNIIRPQHENAQETALDWIPEAHAYADRQAGKPDDLQRYRKIIRRVGCAPEQIQKRGHELADFNHNQWDQMTVFAGTEARTRAYGDAVGKIFQKFYPLGSSHPDDLIHVTCTGYLSPSPAQRLIAEKNWGSVTKATHAYHMGCYASIPGVQMALGYLAASPHKERVDLVHTEICGLHMNPADHSLENFVIQTLFADGFIRYSMSPQSHATGPGLEVLATKEQIIPDTSEHMTWLTGDHGMSMTLSKDVPGVVSVHILAFLNALSREAGMSLESLRSEARFAVHPGGPKILNAVEEQLGLRPEQISASRAVLRDYGNMSSATLPHIWERMTRDESIPPRSPIVSLAFGPGLTLCGAVFMKTEGHK